MAIDEVILFAKTLCEDLSHLHFNIIFTNSYKDPVFFEECKQEYIKEKLEFLRTGIPAKNRIQKLPTSM